MSLHFTVEKLKKEEQQAILEEVTQRAKEVASQAVKGYLEELLERETASKLGREKGQPRRVSSQAREMDWQCGYCGNHDANHVSRDGHYRRNLSTKWGTLQALAVPMLECQHCGHDIVCHFAVFEKYQRYWYDLDQELLWGTGWCESLRQLAERWSETVEGSVGLRTLNERINHIVGLVEQARHLPITDVPPVVQFDGIWTRHQQPTGTIKEDRRKRKRKERKGHKVVVLVALGLWTDGRRAILDWEVATGETHSDWLRLVHRLWERGVQAETGLQAVVRDGKGELGSAIEQVYGGQVVEQRCIFHKLRNVADRLREALPGEAQRESRQRAMEQAAAIYEAESAEQARLRLALCCATWQAQAPKAVATLQRAFEETIAYYALPSLACELVRTTSLLERANRELRRKFRQAGCFTCRTGLEVALYLQVRRFNARFAHQSWSRTSQAIYFASLNLDP